MGFLDSILGKDGDKKKVPPLPKKKDDDNAAAGVKLPTMTNPFAWALPQQAFGGAGQSLGGTQPGIVIPISLFNPGPLGVKVGYQPLFLYLLLSISHRLAWNEYLIWLMGAS